ncbi:MAG: VCBS repeat-containing protein, partial [Planctomycetes bacterium]|nr:VCBS repeat-containing protein [Planctomycetota bacterium]
MNGQLCRVAWWLALCLTPAMIRAASPPPCAIRLLDVTARSGIAFQHTDGGSGRQYIFELMVGGLALLDYDGDGLVDIYFLNGAPSRGQAVATVPRNALYRNNGDGTFTDVTRQAGVGDPGHGLGVTAGDYDNDGDPDLYVNNFGPNVFYRNEGDGTFSDITASTGVACGDKVGAGACFLDVDGDGDLDLYAANYVDFDFRRHDVRAAASFPYPPGPKDYPPVPDSLFRNDGNGGFTDISHSSGIGSLAGPSMGMICLDYDSDGDTDIFVCNDGTANFLFRNDGVGNFAEEGLLAGLAYNLRGDSNGSMGADCGDYDNDGLLDLFMTDYTSESPVLYHGLPGGFFEDVTNAAGAGAAVHPHTNWGAGFVDFDNDGDRDLFIACGHFLSNIPEIDQRTGYRV